MTINKLFLKRVKFSIYGVLLIALSLSCYYHDKVFDTASKFVDKKAIDYGVKLTKVSVFGTKYFDQKSLIALFIKDSEQPLYKIDIDKKLEQILKITWVKNAAVSKKYPNSILIRVTERIPIAYWQHNKELHLIDIEGKVIKTNKLFFGKPLLIGKGANKDAAPFIRLLHKYKSFKIKYATYIGERRWDVMMDNDIIVKLPDENMDQAVHKYMELCARTPIDPEYVTSVDMRYIKDNKIHVQNKKVLRKKNEI